MPDAKISELPAGGDPQDDDAFVVARGATNVSLAWSSLSNAATQNNIAVTLGGNTAGVLALVSSGTLTLAGGANVTLSQAGNAITISGAAGGAETQTAISGIANSQTTYTSGTVSLSELGAITIRSTTGQVFQFSVNPQSVQPETQTFIAGISASDTLYTSGNVRFTGVGGGVTVSSNTGQRVDISVAAQSVQPETQTFVGGIANSQTTYTSGTVSLSELGAITIRSTTGNQFQFSVNAQSVQPETQTFVAGIANSQTTYTSGTVSLSELGAITIRSTTGNQFQFSVNSQTVQTQGVLNVALSNIGNTSGDTGINSGTRYVLAGGNNITLSGSTAANATTVTISAANQTVQTQGILNAGVSTGGNTSGDTTVNTGTRLVFAGGNNITLSQGTAANATTITISAPNLGAGAFSGGVSNLGNSAGSTGITGTRLVLVGSDNITLSQSTDANGGTVSVIGPAAGGFSAGVSTGGNTAGSTGVTGTRMVFVGSGAVSLSQSTAAAGGTVSFNVPLTTLTYYNPYAGEQMVTAAGNATLYMQPYQIGVPAVQFDRAAMRVFYSQATNSTLTASISLSIGIYTRNVSTLSLFQSTSGSISVNGSGTVSSASNVGIRLWTIPWTSTLTMGDYYLGLISRTSTAGANASISVMARSQLNSVFENHIGTAGAGSQGAMIMGLGMYSASTAALPNSLGFSELRNSNSTNVRVPVFALHSGTA